MKETITTIEDSTAMGWADDCRQSNTIARLNSDTKAIEWVYTTIV